MFTKKWQLIVALVGVAVIGGALFACAGAEEEEATPTPGGAETPVEVEATATPIPMPTPEVGLRPESGGVLRLYGYDPVGWDPHWSHSYKTCSQGSWIYSKLTRWTFGPESDVYDFTPVPDLAESWEISEDGLAYTYHLRKGVKFHNKPPVNGRELVAEDVKYTFERFKSSQHANAWWWNVVDRIECPDKYTVVFRLKEAYAPFLTYITSDFSYIVAKEAVDEYGDLRATEAAIGTGPWVLETYQPNVSAIYVRNPDYFMEGLPYIDEVRTPIIADASTRLAALRAGNLDVGGVGDVDYDSVRATNPDLAFFEYVALAMNYIYIRTDVPPFDDVRVRQAVGMAIDREAWLSAKNPQSPGKGVIQGVVPYALKEYYLTPEELGEGGKYLQYNPTEAKRLLAEAGYPDGFSTVMNGTAGYGTSIVEDMELIVDFLARVGIKAEIQLKDYAAHIVTNTWGKYDGLAYCPGTAYYDIDSWLYGKIHSSIEKNASRVNDPKLDAMFEASRKIVDHEEYVQAIHEITRYLAVQNYMYSDPRGVSRIAAQPWIHDYQPKAGGYDAGGRFLRAWIDGTSPTRK